MFEDVKAKIREQELVIKKMESQVRIEKALLGKMKHALSVFEDSKSIHRTTFVDEEDDEKEEPVKKEG